METHAHHLHKAPGKNFWHYFFEFFMLFLAVFCGFLVENFREHKIENEREVQYMKSFVNDLARDTVSLNAGFPLKEQRIVAIDSVLFFFENHSNVNSIPGYVYRNIKRTTWDRHYRRNTGTIDQLKNSGALRLIRNQQVLDSISAYDLQWARADFWRETYISNQRIINDMIDRIVNAPDVIDFFFRNKDFHSGNGAFPDSGEVKIYPENVNVYLNFLFRQKKLYGTG